MTIAELDKLYAQQKAKKAEADNQIDDIKEKIDDLTAQATKVALSGDLEAYKVLVGQIKDAQADLSFMELFRDSLEPKCPEADVSSAWAGYAEGYNKRYAANYKRFEKAKSDLLALYGELLRDQNEALKVRDRISGYCGKAVIHGLVSELEKETPISLLPPNCNTPLPENIVNGNADLVYYVANTCAGEMINRAFEIVAGQKPAEL